ncbi:hypothetical protein L1D34_07130 [Vibrio mediterranei]|uniref:hypothetical protein n=1 Tax=Vibrio mediterranei TaxID=689 RepID=UPI001EFE62F4|nr:hypothetical protein [Vibrio mediterranei]MCG9624611.1 hypothetical protein [Vibrio mediterranei]
MPSALSAQIIIDVTLNQEQSTVDYQIATYEGDCNGINQLTDKLAKQIERVMPKCTRKQGVTEL